MSAVLGGIKEKSSAHHWIIATGARPSPHPSQGCGGRVVKREISGEGCALMLPFEEIIPSVPMLKVSVGFVFVSFLVNEGRCLFRYILFIYFLRS